MLFRNALKLADNRGLLTPGGPEVAERRDEFHREIRAAIRRVDVVDALAASRRAGFIA